MRCERTDFFFFFKGAMSLSFDLILGKNSNLSDLVLFGIGPRWKNCL